MYKERGDNLTLSLPSLVIELPAINAKPAGA
jgi:hypothetical protein